MTAKLDVVTINGYVRELTEPYRHTEPYVTRQRGRTTFGSHRSQHPSLLDQLRETWRATVGDEAGSGIAASKPPITIGALDVLMRIEAASADWVSRGLRLAVRDTPEANVRLLGSRVHDDDPLAVEIERWWRWARVESQWDGRPRALRDPCPECGDRALRVAWDVKAAWCAGCGITWGQGELGVLARVIKQQRADLRNER